MPCSLARARRTSAFTSFIFPSGNQCASVTYCQPLAAEGSERWPRQVELSVRCYFLLEMSSGKVTEARGVEFGVQLLQKPPGGQYISCIFI